VLGKMESHGKERKEVHSMNKGFKIESLHDKQISSLRKTSAREFERYVYDMASPG
jgi:hypothetical protein